MAKRLTILRLICLSGLMISSFVYSLIISPVTASMGELTRILYFHVPLAWVAVIAFFVAGIMAIIFLKNSNHTCFAYFHSSAEIGMVFIILTTVTGAVWAKNTWGSYWNWDPRQTSVFILMLIYFGYFAYYSATGKDAAHNRTLAVYIILALCAVPFLVFIIPRMQATLHPEPVINAQKKITMEPSMFNALIISVIAYTAFYIELLIISAKTMIVKNNILMKKLYD